MQLRWCFILVIFYACSPSRQITKSAKKDLIDDPALQAAHVGISIYDPEKGEYLFNYQGDRYFVPASNTKIPTCYAAMKYLGDSLVGIRYFRRQNVLLVLPTGDPSFYHPDFKRQPVIEFIKNDSAETVIWTNDNFKADPLGNGWSWNDYMASYMAERSAFPLNGNLVRIIKIDSTIPKIYINKSNNPGYYVKGFRIERSLSGVFTAVQSNRNFSEVLMPFVTDQIFISNSLSMIFGKHAFANPPSFENVPSYQSFNKIHSQHTDSVLKPMMHRSDNFFAEQSLLMVSNEMLGIMDDGKIIDSILKTDFKDLPQKPRWADGSGLSRYNLFTPQDFISILNKMRTEFGMERIKEIFPTGNDGTLTNYYKSDSSFIYAKTGTLSGVVALSGFLYTNNNRLLIFSILVNNHQSSAPAIRRAVEKFVKGIRKRH